MAFLFAPTADPGTYRSHDESAAPTNGFKTRRVKSNPLEPANTSVSNETAGQSQHGGIPRKNVVFADSLAFKYLSDDRCAHVTERRRVLSGYELYLVEQWACSRTSPTLVVVTYTGDEKHKIVVGSLSIPVDEAHWSLQLQAYFKATRQYLARPKETELGEILVTNLSSFPSALTVIPVPDGDLRKHRQVFIVNENLKRLGCSGRSGLTINDPTEATQAKFRQLYKTSDRIPFIQSVMELVKMCQVALFFFEKLDHAYIDGLLCDVTETAVGNWWTHIGAEHYNFEPTDGILGPSTVAALLGMLMGARNRLHWYGAPVVKDVFDIENTKRGIAYFQKSNKLEKTRRLDRPTLLKLYMLTAKAAAGEGWGVQKAVKSTMADIGGKRGEMVMGMVGGKDKGGLADIETLDIDAFIGLVHGERSKWLWYGKARRTYSEQGEHKSDGISSNPLSGQDTLQEIARRTQSMPPGEETDGKQDAVYMARAPESATNFQDSSCPAVERDPSRRGVLKHVAGKMSDARSGLGRIKDVVGGRKGYQSKALMGGNEAGNDSPGMHQSSVRQSLDCEPTPGVGRAFTWKRTPEMYLNAARAEASKTSLAPASLSRDHSPSADGSREKRLAEEHNKAQEDESRPTGAEAPEDVVPQVPPAAPSVNDETNLHGSLADTDGTVERSNLELLRRHSLDAAISRHNFQVREAQFPRRMSFGDAEEAVLTWQDVIDMEASPDDARIANASTEVAQQLFSTVDILSRELRPWVTAKLDSIAALTERFTADNARMQDTYANLSSTSADTRFQATEVLASERVSLTESVKEVELLTAKLEYEMNALGTKVRDVEDGVRGFERQVEELERRAEELGDLLSKEGWLHWLVRTVTGVGMPPDITKRSPRIGGRNNYRNTQGGG